MGKRVEKFPESRYSSSRGILHLSCPSGLGFLRHSVRNKKVSFNARDCAFKTSEATLRRSTKGMAVLV